MNYFISRGGQQYGPYTPADLQRYLGERSIQYTDLARTDTMSEWLPLSQILNSSTGAVFPQTVFSPAAQPHGAGPVPPSLHWLLVFVLGLFTGVFHYVWMFVQAAFIKKIDRESKAMLLYVLGLLTMAGGVAVALVFAFVMSSASDNRVPSAPLQHYNVVEPIQLRLSAVMTFFFNTLYLQYHFTRIAKWKETGIIYPQ